MSKVNDSEEKPDCPAFQTTKNCPACGQKDAIVFHVFVSADAVPLDKPRYVCLRCCPKKTVE